MRRTQLLRTSRGFSLVEVLIVLLVMFIIGGALIEIMVSQFRLTASHNRNIINQADLRDVMVFMSDEISLMGTAAVEPFISVASANDFCFIADIDGDNVPNQVRYTLVSGALQRKIYTTSDGGHTYSLLSTDVIMPNVSTAVFQYYGPGNSVGPTLSQISSVKIQLAVNVGATTTALTNGWLAGQALTARVTIRNRLL